MTRLSYLSDSMGFEWSWLHMVASFLVFGSDCALSFGMAFTVEVNEMVLIAAMTFGAVVFAVLKRS